MSEINYFKLYKKAGLIVHNIRKGTKNPIWAINGKIETTYKDITLEDRKNRMDEMEDTKEGYGTFTGEQYGGRFIIGLDFDIYDRNTDGEKEEVQKAFDIITRDGREPTLFNTSTCGNQSMIVDITDDKELIEVIKSQEKDKIENIEGFEILCGMNYVLPSTATICKKHNKICQGRQFYTYDTNMEDYITLEDHKRLKLDYEFNIINKGFYSDKIRNYFKSIVEMKKKDKKEKKETKEKKEKKVEKVEDIEDIEDKEKKTKLINDDIVEIDNELINKLLNSLKPKYYNNYTEWLDIGMAIKNLGLPFKLWDNFSRKSKKYEDGCCAKKWETFGNDYKLGLGRLLYYLKDSDYTVYEEIESALNSSYINFSCLTPEVYTRQLIHILNDNIIFCGNDKQKECYKWNNYYWEMLDDEYIEIKKLIKNDLCKHFIKLLDTKSLKSDYIKQNKIKIRNSIKQYLENSRNYDTIINNLKIELYKKDVKFNKNDYIFQFNNACYDLKQGKFIEPERENYITISCGYSYDFLNEKNENKYDSAIKKIENFFKSIVDNDYIYLLDYLSTGLQRQNIEQKSLFCYGTGRNGKGLTYTLLKNALGLYFADIKMEYFTTYEKGADTPSSNLYDCRNARFIVASEIDGEGQNGKDQKMVSSKFKKLTGGDTIQVRQLYAKNQVNFSFGQLMFLLNHLPQMPVDVAMRERVMILHFKYNFVSKPTKPTDKLIDKSLGDLFKSDEYKQAFIRILFKHYETYKQNGLIIPQSVEEFTKKQFEKMSEIQMWLMDPDTSPIERDADSRVEVSTLYEIYTNNKMVSKTFFGKEINKIEDLEIRTIRGYNYVIGYKLKPIPDDEDE